MEPEGQVALPSLIQLEIYPANQTQNAVFTAQICVVDRVPAAKFYSVPSFRHYGSLAYGKSGNLWEQICTVSCLKV